MWNDSVARNLRVDFPLLTDSDDVLVVIFRSSRRTSTARHTFNRLSAFLNRGKTWVSNHTLAEVFEKSPSHFVQVWSENGQHAVARNCGRSVTERTRKTRSTKTFATDQHVRLQEVQTRTGSSSLDVNLQTFPYGKSYALLVSSLYLHTSRNGGRGRRVVRVFSPSAC